MYINFHSIISIYNTLQLIIQLSRMRTNSLYLKQHMAPFLGEISLFKFKYFQYVQIVDQQCSNILNSHMMGIAGSQVRFEAREPIVSFFAAVPGNSRSKTVYTIFDLKFPFTKKLQLLVLSSEMSKNIDISIYKTLLKLVLPSVQTPHPDILK